MTKLKDLQEAIKKHGGYNVTEIDIVTDMFNKVIEVRTHDE